jgi:hypothetical protein
LKAREAMEVGYCGYWTRRFLLAPSQTLTVPSPPPVANVPNKRSDKGQEQGVEEEESTEKWVKGEGVHGVGHVALAMAFESVVAAEITRAVDIEILDRHPTLRQVSR